MYTYVYIYIYIYLYTHQFFAILSIDNHRIIKSFFAILWIQKHHFPKASTLLPPGAGCGFRDGNAFDFVLCFENDVEHTMVLVGLVFGVF